MFAHPVRREAWRRFDAAWVPLLSGIELWNRKANGLSWGPEALALIPRTGLPTTVGQDFHRWRQIWPLTHIVQVAATGLLEVGLVAALAAGETVPQACGRPFWQRTATPARLCIPHFRRASSA